MRDKALRAILYAQLDIPEIAAAFIAQRVQRTVAEHTVKILVVFYLVARKISAGGVFIVTKAVFLHKFAQTFLLSVLKRCAVAVAIY